MLQSTHLQVLSLAIFMAPHVHLLAPPATDLPPVTVTHNEAHSIFTHVGDTSAQAGVLHVHYFIPLPHLLDEYSHLVDQLQRFSWRMDTELAAHDNVEPVKYALSPSYSYERENYMANAPAVKNALAMAKDAYDSIRHLVPAHGTTHNSKGRQRRFLDSILLAGGMAYEEYQIQSLMSGVRNINNNVHTLMLAQADSLDNINHISKSMVKMQAGIKQIADTTKVLAKAIRINTLSTASIAARTKANAILSTVDGLRDHRLSLHAMTSDSWNSTFNNAKALARNKDYVLVPKSPLEMADCPVSFVIQPDGTIIVVQHVPIYKAGSKLNIYRHRPMPIRLRNASPIFATLAAASDHLAVSPDRTIFKALSADDVAMCRRQEGMLVCPLANYAHKINNVHAELDANNFGRDATCLYSLFRRRYQQANNTCNVLLSQPRNEVIQISQTEFVLFSRSPTEGIVTCSEGEASTSFAVSTYSVVTLRPGCTATTPSLTFTAAIDLNVPANHELFTWPAADLQPLVDDNLLDAIDNIQSSLGNVSVHISRSDAQLAIHNAARRLRQDGGYLGTGHDDDWYISGALIAIAILAILAVAAAIGCCILRRHYAAGLSVLSTAVGTGSVSYRDGSVHLDNATLAADTTNMLKSILNTPRSQWTGPLAEQAVAIAQIVMATNPDPRLRELAVRVKYVAAHALQSAAPTPSAPPMA